MEFDFIQPSLDTEAGTGLVDVREITMTKNFGFGIVYAQTRQEILERLLLGLRTGICRIAVGVETAFVTDADTVCIEMAGVGADF